MPRLDLLFPGFAGKRALAVGVAAAALAIGGAGYFALKGQGPNGDAAAALEKASREAEHEAFTTALQTREAETIEVARGESLALVLSRAGAPWADVNAAVMAVAQVYNPRQLRPGQNVEVYFRTDGEEARLTGLAFRADAAASVTVGRGADGQFWAREFTTPWAMTVTHIKAKINDSLYQSALAAGASEQEVAALSDVFAYDVDFQRDIQPGDEFELLFDRYVDDDGRTIRTDNLRYAALNTRRGPKAYYYFQGPEEKQGSWYDQSGRSARKSLMKTPIDGARLTSGFGMRLHPILGYSKMHRGVDFGAGTGTPIRAAGDGVVVRASYFGSYGNYVRIRHENRYETAYAHMSRFGAGMRAGARVRQGQIIGFVGSTGRATGPHLHYEVLYKNAQVNPVTLKLATGRNLAGRELDMFKQERDRIDAARNGGANTALIASASSPGVSPDLRGGLE
ncbi:MAG: peptidoglycan DD-metalloendopeptidase family protein [Hyphomonadaceae bacterium]